METVRGNFTGVLNIVRFNWHFYAVAIAGAILAITLAAFLPAPFSYLALGLLALGFVQTTITLLASHWIYDRSEIRTQKQLDNLPLPPLASIVSIHAGFDETSEFLRDRYPDARLEIWDFYNPAIHTEPSIQRARKRYPPHPDQCTVDPAELPADAESIDGVFLIFAAHEFRSAEGQKTLFREAHRILAPGGRVIVVEHLRDLPNLTAFSVGFFHFFSKPHWKKVFEDTGFKIGGETKTTPFISTFVLEK